MVAHKIGFQYFCKYATRALTDPLRSLNCDDHMCINMQLSDQLSPFFLDMLVYKPHTWVVAVSILSTGSILNLKWQEGQQGKKFQDARASPETLAFEQKYSLRPGEQKDALTQVDFTPLSHSNWLKRE